MGVGKFSGSRGDGLCRTMKFSSGVQTLRTLCPQRSTRSRELLYDHSSDNYVVLESSDHSLELDF